jgi:intracellular multiplication protein IcmL
MQETDEEKPVLEPEWFKGDHYKSFMVLTFLIGALVFVLIQVNLFLRSFASPAPVFFKVTQGGALVPEKPLNEPNQRENLLLNWTAGLMMTINTFNFVNYNAVINKAALYFVPEGYDNFKAALNQFKITQTVIDKKLILSTTPLDAPHVVLEKVFAGRYMWKIQMPLLFKYSSVEYVASEQYVVTLIVMRVPITESPQGIRILKYDLTPLDRA